MAEDRQAPFKIDLTFLTGELLGRHILGKLKTTQAWVVPIYDDEPTKDQLAIVQLHAVSGEGDDSTLEIHTHGLAEYGHSEFSVIVDSLFYVSAGQLLRSLADAVINEGEIFKDGENCSWCEWGTFKLEKNIDSATNLVLRIMSLPRGCGACEVEPT